MTEPLVLRLGLRSSLLAFGGSALLTGRRRSLTVYPTRGVITYLIIPTPYPAGGLVGSRRLRAPLSIVSNARLAITSS